MKHFFIVLLGLSQITCTSTKKNLYDDRNNLIVELVELIINQTFQDREVCIHKNSISFDFQFTETFKGGDVKLSNEEIKFIEENFNNDPIIWNVYLQTKYKSKGFDCLGISKPILLRNNTFAFVYINHFGASYFSIYEMEKSAWRFKENLITIFGS